MTSLRGPRVTGPLAPELPILYSESARYATVASVPVAEVKRVKRETEDAGAEPG
jgi:hypothetical protein